MPISCSKVRDYYRTTAVGLLRCATGNKNAEAPVIPVTRDEAVDINTYIFVCCRPVAIRRSFRLPRPFPTATFPPPTTKPLAGAGKQNRQAMSVIENLPPGNAELRQAIVVAMPYRASPFLLMKLSLLPGVRGIKPQFASGN